MNDAIEDDDPGAGPAAIVLAAGASRRMGRNKMLLPFGSESLVRRAVWSAVDAGCAPVIVVTGLDADAVVEELSGMPCNCINNPDYTGPTSASLHRGLGNLPAGVDATLLLLGDMPFVSSTMLAALVSAAGTHVAPLAASRYGDVLAPPLMFRRALFGELLAWHGEGCGKQVVQRHRHEALIFDWPIEALADVDTPADYDALVAGASAPEK
ncbi:MAG TPA: nucleotidyltransferase family protein [Gemmatimonadales bacterium]